uniref:EAL domain-containing protein n=1 Tax=Eubacterium cellulosolvens TaxID=29322 RepID=UPI001A9A1D6C|nr:EAL domain-containing protein [[Eubacterium] cellulosolvens]
MTRDFDWEYLRNKYDMMPGNILICGRESGEDILYANDELLDLVGCASKEAFLALTGGKMRGFIFEEDFSSTIQVVSAHLVREKDRFSHISFRIYNCEHSEITVVSYGRILDDPELGKICVLSLSESDVKAKALLTDPLTGLMGMHRFREEMSQEMKLAAEQSSLSKYSLVFFDLTNFKLFNMKYGVSSGDRLLCEMAEILKSVYGDRMVARFSDDHFVVLTDRQDVTESILVVNIKTGEIDQNTILQLKAGIRYLREEDAAVSVEMICDQAKLACDSIKHDATDYTCEYNEQLTKQIELKTYVNANIEKAINQGYIKVYYQPVIRTLTGKLCGVEALARWIDPEYGILSPSDFIPYLEEAHLIQMLDNYVIYEVGRQMRAQLDNRIPVVPCSFNLSRVDFIMGDPFREVENVIRKFGLQRNLFRIEITESMIMQDEERIMEQVNQFHDSGYEVWMDDFGSGYSSLNTLKDFHFDEIKIDMLFLRDLNEKGRSIIASMVSMAKKLGVHTLAEGVEYDEQVEFLKSIGCEKMQGYYYGMPMSGDKLFEFCRESCIEVESASDAYIQDQVGLENLISDSPIALIEDDGRFFHILFENDSFREAVSSMKNGTEDNVNAFIRSPYYALNKTVREFVDKPVSSGKKEKITFIENGQYMRLTARTIAGNKGYYIHKIGLFNITYDDAQERTRRNDEIIRNIAVVYKGVYLWSVKDSEIEIIMSERLRDEGSFLSVDRFRQKWMREMIYPGDRQRFDDFFQTDAIHRKIRIGKHATTSDVFRIRNEKGNFEWIELTALILQHEREEKILILGKPAEIDEYLKNADFIVGMADMHNFDSEGREWQKDGDLWRALMENSDIKYFWKDRQCRFVGVNRAFLEYFGLKSAKEIIGKTDQDMKWHPDNGPFRDDERRVIERGEVVSGTIGECMIRGCLHKIIANRVPIYRDGKIDGLIGYFDDLDAIQGRRYDSLYLRDPITGFMNFRGALDAGTKFEENFKMNGENYIGILIDVSEYNRFLTSYGAEAANELVCFVGEKIRKYADTGAAISRHSECRFQIFEKGSDTAAVRERLHRLADEIHAVREVAGYSCTLYMNYSIAVGSEVETTAALFRVLMERMEFAEEEDLGRIVYMGDRLVFDREKFDDMAERVYMCDPENYDLVYLNHAGREDLHLPEDFSCTGRKCYEVLEGREEPCEFCTIPVTRRDRFHTWTSHNQKNGKDYLMRDTLVPWRGKNYRFSMSVALSDYIHESEMNKQSAYRRILTIDAVSIALQAQDPETGIQRMIEKMGQGLGADRVFIFEQTDEGRLRANYEWHRSDLIPLMQEWQSVPVKIAEGLYRVFEKNRAFVLPDVQEVERIRHRDPELFGKIEDVKIREMICVELKFGGKSAGFFGVINPTKDSVENTERILMILSRYISILIRNRDMLRRLDILGSRDALTGVMNRRAFRDMTRNMHDKSGLVVIYGDVNGLKTVNDTRGHEAGDELIKVAADVMSSIVGAEQVFRMGGDEFIIVTQSKDKKESDELMKMLRDSFEYKGISVALGCVYNPGEIKDVGELMHEADRRMYINKQYMHKRDSGEKTSEKGKDAET